MAESNGSSCGNIFLSLLAVLFIGLKLTGYINWSWWWVLAPLWGGLVFVAVLLMILAALSGAVGRK